MAGFDGGKMTSDAGALLLGATDLAIRLVDRFADCFGDSRAPELIEHTVGTLVKQRIFALALGYEDLVDHDELRHRSDDGGAGRQALGPPRGLRTVGRQIDPQPAGAERAGADPSVLAHYLRVSSISVTGPCQSRSGPLARCQER
jgi:DDE family transposase